MNLSKIFLLNILLFLNLNVYAEVDFYQSNYNGLNLLNQTTKKKYKFYIQVFSTNNKIQKKILYKDNQEIKRWIYYYNFDYISREEYYKDRQLKEEYRYDQNKHKIKQTEYKNGKPLKVITYTYNKDGLVDKESSLNLLTNQTIMMKYRYDSNFKIKQIEKLYPDGRLVFWESFFTAKGIIIKEYYTLKNEKFTFWYNENGQEIKGIVTEILDKDLEKTKKEWQTFYTKNGKIDKREENNYITDQKIITWYYPNYKEKRIERYKKNELVSIETYEYNDKNKVTLYKIIEDLDSTKYIYEYDKDGETLIKKLLFKDDVLKKATIYNEDKTKIEILYNAENKRIMIEYDKNGKIVSQKELE